MEPKNEFCPFKKDTIVKCIMPGVAEIIGVVQEMNQGLLVLDEQGRIARACFPLNLGYVVEFRSDDASRSTPAIERLIRYLGILENQNISWMTLCDCSSETLLFLLRKGENIQQNEMMLETLISRERYKTFSLLDRLDCPMTPNMILGILCAFRTKLFRHRGWKTTILRYILQPLSDSSFETWQKVQKAAFDTLPRSKKYRKTYEEIAAAEKVPEEIREQARQLLAKFDRKTSSPTT